MLALLMFFLFERLISMIGEWRVTCKSRNQVELPHSSMDGHHAGHGILHHPRNSATSMQIKVVRTGHQARYGFT